MSQALALLKKKRGGHRPTISAPSVPIQAATVCVKSIVLVGSLGDMSAHSARHCLSDLLVIGERSIPPDRQNSVAAQGRISRTVAF